MHKRFLITTDPQGLINALSVYPDIVVRRDRNDPQDERAYAIEGPDNRRAVINKAVDLFNSDVD